MRRAGERTSERASERVNGRSEREPFRGVVYTRFLCSFSICLYDFMHSACAHSLATLLHLWEPPSNPIFLRCVCLGPTGSCAARLRCSVSARTVVPVRTTRVYPLSSEQSQPQPTTGGRLLLAAVLYGECWIAAARPPARGFASFRFPNKQI
jgi:hypothetical protein